MTAQMASQRKRVFVPGFQSKGGGIAVLAPIQPQLHAVGLSQEFATLVADVRMAKPYRVDTRKLRAYVSLQKAPK